MKLSVCLFMGIVLMILESSVLSFLPLDFFKPDFGVPLIIYTTLFLGPLAGLLSAIVLGLIQEVLSNAPAGSVLFTKLSIFIICTFLRNKLYIDSKYSFSYVCSGFVVLESFLFLTLSLLSKGETGNILNVMFYTIPNAIFTGFLSIFIFAFIEYLDLKFLSRE
jgi:rod shape-determining protein MreD